MLSRLIILLLLSVSLMAETRTWRSADGESSFAGDFISRDGQSITIRRKDGKVFALSIHKLGKSDQDWLAELKLAANPDAKLQPDPNAIFDTLCFGDSRKEVTAKLIASKNVETLVDETFIGRFGLNGTFRTKQKIGGLYCELYFDWSNNGTLKEISLRTQPQDSKAYDKLLNENWSQLAEDLTMLHGKPLQRAGYPKASDLQDELFLASHLWRLESGGSALLGTSMKADKYLVVVRFTTEKIKPVRTK